MAEGLEDGKLMFVRDKNVTELLFYCKFHLDLHLTLLCSCLLQNDLFIGM